MKFIGASDTAGYCVNGNPKMGSFKTILEGWEFSNCGMSYPSVISRYFNATYSVQASSGIGLVQNGYAKQKWKLGDLTMPAYYNRTLQTSEHYLWDFKKFIPNVVFINLGGNDYNHQGGDVLTNATFEKEYFKFLTFLFNVV